MRYAVYFSTNDEPAVFGSSYANKEQAQMAIDNIHRWSRTQKAFMIEVWRSDQQVDPYAEDADFQITVSQANKRQREKSRASI
jgi:hypothetical protein